MCGPHKQNNMALHVQHTFLYISLCSLHDYKVKFLHDFMEGASTPQRFFLSPSKLEFSLQEIIFKSSLMCPFPRSNLYWPPIG